ncbi:hypothetical protein Golomagni_03227 [Golovinomyces magnicellulatus]|nr:hypothetical protein Golomagni_03227 [Golovinomyces magnicellulatus]
MPTIQPQDALIFIPSQTIPLRDLTRPTENSDGDGRISRSVPEETRLTGSSSRIAIIDDDISIREIKERTSQTFEKLDNTSLTSKKTVIINDKENFRDDTAKINRSPALQQTIGFAGLVIPNKYDSRSPESILKPNVYDDVDNLPLNDRFLNDSSSIFIHQELEKTCLTDFSSLELGDASNRVTREYPINQKPRLRFNSINYGDSNKNHGHVKLNDESVDTEAEVWPSMPPQAHGNVRGRLASRASSNATGALSRAGTIVRAMSQRVVNISGETQMIEATAQLEASRGESTSSAVSKETRLNPSDESGTLHEPKRKSRSFIASSISNPHLPTAPIDKAIRFFGGFQTDSGGDNKSNKKLPNPLRGNTLGIFPPESKIRNKLCNLLVYPLTEPLILILIIVQVILLALESSKSVYESPRHMYWGASPIDYALLTIFTIFTIELAARILVSGFIFNAPEYSSQRHKKSLKSGFLQNLLEFVPIQRKSPTKAHNHPRDDESESCSLAVIQSGFVKTVEQAQRLQLARRAFLRHSFNRLDFVAVCAFWVTFVLSLTGIEERFHIYLFRMLSCLRILRLLALTNGTAIILRSLKKAAPLLINISFLIGFFWLLFAVIGVQSFKSSLDRQCVWIDPADPANLTGSAYINSFQFCGGQINVTTGAPDSWVVGPLGDLSPGAESPKGFLCPRGSYCLELSPEQLPYRGTVSFDNIFQSLELVFVVMTANTFSDIMYYTIDSDYPVSSFFFVGVVVFMMLWLLNLLIAIITSSFQVIREESKASVFAAQAKIVQVRGDEVTIQKHPKALKDWFDKTYLLWIVLIGYGIVCQTFRSSNMSNSLMQFIGISEAIVTLFLSFEIIIRFLVDWREFFFNNRNLVDLGLALITTVMLAPPIRNSERLYAWLTFFQIARIYRLIIAIPVTRSLITLVLGNSSGIRNLMLFVFLLTFLVSIFAVQLFRGELSPEDDFGQTIQVTFFTNWNAFLGMYQILSSENWTALLYNLTSSTTAHNTAWVAGAFIIGWFILGNFILMNMFIAVIQENFDVSEDEKRMHQVKAFLNRKELGDNSYNLSLSAVIRFGRSRKKKDPLDYGPATMEMLLKDTVVKDFLEDEIKENQVLASQTSSSLDLSTRKNGKKNSLWQKFKNNIQNKEPNPFFSTARFSSVRESGNARAMAKEVVSATTQRKKAQREYLARYPNYNISLYIFKPSNPIRRLCQRVVGPGRGSERFDGVEPNLIVWYSFSAIIYTGIIAMVLIACMTTPLYQKRYYDTHNSNEPNWILRSDIGFAILFSVEALIKAIADGFYWTPNAYFRSSWGLIDIIVLITFWFNIISSILNNGVVSRAIGALKALRALRLLNFSESTRDTFHSLIIVAGWKIISAAFVSLSLLFPFAIYGVNLFNGKMLSCNDTDPSKITLLTDCFGEYNSTPFSSEWPILAPRVVSNPFFDFDRFGSSLFILFQIVSQEGWVDVMWAAQSIVGRGLQPQPFSSQENVIFFVIFNLLATVFVLTLFISVFMRSYTEKTGVAFLTAEQRSWLELRKLLRQVAPSKRQSKKTAGKFRSWCYTRAIQKHGAWHKTVSVMLVCHLLLLLAEFHPQPLWWDEARNYIFFAFTLFFMANIFIRIFGLGWSRFRRNSWDLYSLLVVSGTFGTTILFFLQLKSQAVIQLHKFFLLMIVLLLIPRNNSLDQLFKTAGASVASIGNLLATWFVLFLVYAIALNQVFGLTRFGPNGDNNQNFRTVPKALVLLFRMSCGEGWNFIMEDYANIQPPFCVSAPSFFNSDCGSPKWARVLFISWNILSMYIFTSLFVSLIYESFSYVYQRSSGLNKVNREEIRRFKQAWATVDPNGSGYISKEQLPRLLKQLTGVFAIKIYPPEHSIRQILKDVNQASVRTPVNAASGLDLMELNRRISMIDPEAVRQSRNQFNLFYEEIMVSADTDRGISFTTFLMVLAHYRVIHDNKSLKLEEFLRRRARLQRVEEQVRRRTVLGFFDTMYWSRRFRQHLEKQKSSQSLSPPKLGPDLSSHNSEMAQQKSCKVQSPLLKPQDHNNSSTILIDNNLDRRTCHRRSISRSFSHASPVLAPSLSLTSAVSTGFAPETGDKSGSNHSSRRGSSTIVMENVLDVLDDSAWGESIRRSFILRRSS